MEHQKIANAAHVRVVKHLPLGLSVELENGQRGIVRIREISWDAHERNRWKDDFPVGWRGLAVPIRTHHNQFNEFSIRLAQNDPWENITERIQPGDVFNGIVNNVEDFGAFIEIEPGLIGLLHYKQFPRWVTKKPPELFWPGDHVRVLVDKIDTDQRRISLGLPTAGQGPESAPEAASVPRKTSGLQEFLGSSARHLHILVVEDDPVQSQAISTWLKQVNQGVDTVSSAEEALAFVERQQPDLALIDVGLANEMNGIELAQILLEKYPAIRTVITTDGARADQLESALNDLQARSATLLLKPILPDDLLTILDDTGGEPAPKSAVLRPSAGKSARPRQAIQGQLRQCREHLGFDAAILFAFDRQHRSVSIVEKSSELALNLQAVTSLKYSPVRDVAEDKDVILLEDCPPEYQARFRYLLELLPMAACIGVPIPVKRGADHALFLLHSRPKKLVSEHKLYADASALAIGAMLEFDIFRQQSILIQRTALIGQMTSSMIHEINNMLGPLTTNMETLQYNMTELRKSPSDVVREVNARNIHEDIVEIQANIRRIKGTMLTVGRIIKKSKSEILLVEDIIDETIHLIKDISHQAKVVIKFTEPAKMTLIRAQAAALEQVLFNILLNAIQQINEFRQGQGGWVYIWLEPNCSTEPGGMVRICIEDTGPGIHGSLWEQVFEVGYTTRDEGSGIGLYISRNLMEDMDGKIYVRESHILGGTTFVVELPCHMAGQK
jgi:signal transduction histidine kinase/DNA-binding NarL/FixJ family response regulator/predicted RNA-binding protein with RPS1 domain